MNSRNEYSTIQVILEEVRALRNEMNIQTAAIRADMNRNQENTDDELEEVRVIAQSAHTRIDRYENRFWGWMAGVGGGGAITGASLANPSFLKAIGRALFG
ncbi:hypothetical protein [Agrobacterium tumefaciens]|uniref:Uncharacterized protein n=1 Tax=Agrobacterium tumefaciens TaxID=358 RepID=A0A176WW58_AGRTU|nr:hypothetical protein [Agrobacterium tumefaciens]OAE37633.1 hypothetical protein A7J57_08630 [Agrobacterium tumefaciens]